MYVFLGWLNVGLIAVMTAPFWLRFLNDHTFRLKGGAYGQVIKFLRTIHKPLGIAVIIIALIHAYLAWGTLRLHTGSFLWFSIFIAAVLGASFYFTKKKPLFFWHKRVVMFALVLLLVHLLFPNAVYTLLRL